MKTSQKFKRLEYHEFRELIRGALREQPDFINFYNWIDTNVTEITIDGFEIEGNHLGTIEISNLISPLSLVFNNCRLPSVIIQGALQKLSFLDCEVTEIDFENGLTRRLEILGKKSIIGLLKITQGLVNELFLSSNVNKVLLTEGSRATILTANIDGNISFLEINSFGNINLVCKSIIGECRINKTPYPFRESVTIKSLIFKSSDNAILTLKGLFDSVYLESNNGSILFKDFICLGNLTVIDQKSGGQNSPYIKLKNIYVGGKATFTRCDSVFEARLDDKSNKHFFLNELEFNENIRLLEFKTMKWELNIHINKLIFNDIHFSNDAFWTIQGLLCHEIVFNYFRNAGFGNIATTYGGKFESIHEPYDNVLTIYKDKETDNVIDNWIDNAITSYDFTGYGGALTLNYSDLGKINFIDNDFSDFTLYFNSTKLSEIYLAGSKLPKIVKASEFGGLPEALSHQERIANSQLKKLLEQHGDMLAANEYFANEMNAYYNSLNWRTHFWEKLPLAFNKYSSNHGQSWIRALTCTLVISLFFYILFINCLGYHLANPLNGFAWKTFFLIASLYLDFLNPIHKLDSFQTLYTNHRLDPELRFIDGIGRIFIAYCVFQLIQAFRKHGRK
jgi:hypothetical protein